MKILIGVDGSSQGLAGARWVAKLPLSSTDEVVVVSVHERPVMIAAWGFVHTDATGRLLDEAWKVTQAEAHRATEEAASELTGLPCTVRTLVRDGHPVATLPRIISELAADLVVLGPHGRGRLDSILLGSVSQSLLHSMLTSILVAREPVRAPERVLLAFDGSPHSLAAARFLAHFPLPPGARIDVLTSAGALSDGYTAYGAADLRDLVALEGRHAAEVIQQAVEVLSSAGRDARPVLRHGDPKREILAAAGEFESDLIVMGARGIGGFRGLILGSVSRAVSKAAPCSTLVVAHRAGASA
jgi:nucleotide-binding universal stress UspA family protein